MNLTHLGFEFTDVSRLNNFIEGRCQNSLLERTIVLILPETIFLHLRSSLSAATNLYVSFLWLVTYHLIARLGCNSSLSTTTDLDIKILWLDFSHLSDRVGCFRV